MTTQASDSQPPQQRPDPATVRAILAKYGVKRGEFGQTLESALHLLNHEMDPLSIEDGCAACCGQENFEPEQWNGVQAVIFAHYLEAEIPTGNWEPFDDRQLAAALGEALRKVPGVRRVDVVDESL